MPFARVFPGMRISTAVVEQGRVAGVEDELRIGGVGHDADLRIESAARPWHAAGA